MCGIAGFLQHSPSMNEGEAKVVIQRMADSLRHRGPDDEGYWLDAHSGIALGHRRLSILDLSDKGRQPMLSHNQRFCMIYNGEVYNFQELRDELISQGAYFQGHSDTEVILEAIAQWGVKPALRRFAGMFAFAVWDIKEKKLYLARDRMGEKPLYYGWSGEVFLFASELKALCAFPHFSREVDRDALALFFRHSSIPAPYSIYRNIYKLPPATCLIITPETPAGNCPSPEPYWSFKQILMKGSEKEFSDEEALERFHFLLARSVKQEMIADVPLGVFLSGGVDSASIAALMQAQTSKPVKTFTIGFYESKYNEAVYAKAVAQRLGTEHTEFYVTPREAMSVIPDLPSLYDEPFADASQIPTFLMSRLARRHVTVCLSGDGGDEQLAGYDRYYWTLHLWNRLSPVPYPLRSAAASILRAVLGPWKKIYSAFIPFLPNEIDHFNLNDKIQRMIDILTARGPEEVYRRLISHWTAPGTLVLGVREEPLTAMTDPAEKPDAETFLEEMMYFETRMNLPDTLLTKVDRASMAVGLEVRAPFLDHRLVEFAATLPLKMKFRQGERKWILRRLLEKYVPSHLIDRPKAGFDVPIGLWLKGPLRDWAESLLSEDLIRRQGFLDPLPVRKMWKEHVSGEQGNHYYLWDALMFQAWLEKNGGSS